MASPAEAAEKTGHVYKAARVTTSEPSKFMKSGKISAHLDDANAANRPAASFDYCRAEDLFLYRGSFHGAE